MTEKQLIKDCRKGVKSSQYLLVQRYSGMLLSVCRRYARDEAMARDLLQETLIRVFTHIDKYQPTGSFEAWMRQIAIRRSLQWLGKVHFQQEQQVDALPDNEPEVPEVYVRMEVEEIMQLVHSLPPGFRTVFNLSAVEGYSHQEIAEMLGISENTSRSQLMRARKMLQEKIRESKKNGYHEVASIRK